MNAFRYSPTFAAPGVVRFLPAQRVTTDDGDATKSYGGPDYSTAGVAVAANLQRKDGGRSVVDGVDHYVTPSVGVCLLDDPGGLNGGKGVKRGDAFWWSMDPGRLMIAQEDATPRGGVWRVLCEFSQ